MKSYTIIMLDGNTYNISSTLSFSLTGFFIYT